MAARVRVFISYSHKDDALRDKLRTHLSQLEHDGLVQTWDDRAIPAGHEWADEIDLRLEEADVILLLVSADFLRSDYCYRKEMARALERHAAADDGAIVVPVILRKCDWQTAPFGKLQGLPRDGRPISDDSWKTEDDYFEAIAKGLRKCIESLVAYGPPSLTTDSSSSSNPKLVTKLTFLRRPLVVTSVSILVLALTWGGFEVRSSVAAVNQAIQEAEALFSVGTYGATETSLLEACQRWIVGSPACFALDKARLGALLEAPNANENVEKFQQQLAQLVRRHPDEDPDLLLFDGTLQLFFNDAAIRPQVVLRARDDFMRALKIRKNFPEAWYRLGAMALFDARETVDERKAQTYLAQAKKYLDNAVGNVDGVAGEREHSPAPHYYSARGWARLELGDVVGAESDYRQSANAGLIQARTDLGALLWRKGDFAAAADLQRSAMLALSRTPLKGRNALPWTVELSNNELLTLSEPEGKSCFARVAWQASLAVLGQAQVPDLNDCGKHGSEIGMAVSWSLERALGGNLPAGVAAFVHRLPQSHLRPRGSK